jgi:hypothetical protein
VFVNAASEDGVQITSADRSGVWIDSAGLDGITVWSADRHGILARGGTDDLTDHGGTFYGYNGVSGEAGAVGNVYAYGVKGQAGTSNARGVYGFANAGGGTTVGVLGRSQSVDGFGLAGENYYSGVGLGVWTSSGNLIEAYDGIFPGGDLRFYLTNDGHVYADGGFSPFSAVNNIQTGETEHRTLHAISSPEVWFEDFGNAQLADGKAVVTIEPVFAQTVNLDAYHVFLTPLGDCPLYVAEKTPAAFAVGAMGGQTCNIAFDYRIVAKRLGYEEVRLETVTLDADEESGE